GAVDHDATRVDGDVHAGRHGDGLSSDSRHAADLPDEGHDLAADAALGGSAVGDETVRGGQDRGAHPAEHARQAVLARVDAAAGLRDALQVGDHAFAAAPVLELHDEVVERLAALDVEVLDVALVLQQAGDLELELGRR